VEHQEVLKQRNQKAFLAAYSELGNISAAAKTAKVARSQHYVWLKNVEYEAEFNAAQETAIESLEAEARRRAMEGTERPVFQGGVKVGLTREYSDTLLIFLLKAANPLKYRDHQTTKHTGSIEIADRLAAGRAPLARRES
jgi:hypothetical protein